MIRIHSNTTKTRTLFGVEFSYDASLLCANWSPQLNYIHVRARRRKTLRSRAVNAVRGSTIPAFLARWAIHMSLYRSGNVCRKKHTTTIELPQRLNNCTHVFESNEIRSGSISKSFNNWYDRISKQKKGFHSQHWMHGLYCIRITNIVAIYVVNHMLALHVAKPLPVRTYTKVTYFPFMARSFTERHTHTNTHTNVCILSALQRTPAHIYWAWKHAETATSFVLVLF